MTIADTTADARAVRIALVGTMDADKARETLSFIAGYAPEIFDAATIGRDQRQHDRLPAAGSRFRCALGEPGRPCTTYARVTIADRLDSTARGCIRHAIDSLDHIDGTRVLWDDTKGLSEFELIALRLTGERSALRPGGAR